MRSHVYAGAKERIFTLEACPKKYLDSTLPMRPGQCQKLTAKRQPCPSQAKRGFRWCGWHIRQWMREKPQREMG